MCHEVPGPGGHGPAGLSRREGTTDLSDYIKLSDDDLYACGVVYRV